MADETQTSDVNETVEQDVGNTLDTQPENESQETEQDTPQQSTLDADAAQKELSKVRKEAAKYRTKLRELETKVEGERKNQERSKMEESERLKAEKAEIEAKLNEREQALAQTLLQIELQGKVANPKAAIKLLDDNHFDADGAIDLDAFFKDFPELKPQATKQSGGTNNVELDAPSNPPEVPSGRNSEPRTKLTRADIAAMTPEQYKEGRQEIYRAIKEGRL